MCQKAYIYEQMPFFVLCRVALRKTLRRVLGFSAFSPDNIYMSTETENPQGFVFPGVFEITAMGSASANLQTAIPHELEQAGLTVLHETVTSRASSAGRFVSVSLSFKANSRADYETAHNALRAHPEIKWTL